MAHTETVVSVLLSDPPPVLVAPVRPVDPDYAATVDAKFIETDVDVWFDSLGGRS